MNAAAFNESKLPNRHVTEGPPCAQYLSGPTGEQIHCTITVMGDVATGHQAMESSLVSTSIGLIMRGLIDGGYPHADCLTAAGEAMEWTLEIVKFNADQRVVCAAASPISGMGAVVGLQGSLASDGVNVKVAGMNNLQFRKPVRAFECEKVVVGGFIARSRDGDAILFVAEKGTLDLQENSAELAGRRKSWIRQANPYQSGVLRKYADQAGPARDGAVTDGGGRAEVVCYADI